MIKSRAVTILQINDTHGYIEPHPELVWTEHGPEFPELGGYERIAALFDAVRRERPGAVLALDNGDTFHGTFAAVHSKGEDLVPLVNALKLDAMTAHWEFAWGPKHFFQLASRLDHPVLAINCYDKGTGFRPFAPSTVIERAGLRIGIVGIAASITDKTMPPHFSEGLRFSDGTDELPAEIERLRRVKGADLVIVLSHLGLPQDVKLAMQVAGIDVVASGHTHNRLEHPIRVGGTVIMQSGCHGSFVGRLDVTLKGGQLNFEHRLIPVDASLPSDLRMKAMVDEVLAPHRAMLGEVVGQTTVALHRNTSLRATMDDLLLAAVARAAGTRVAFSNGWRYGAAVPPGPVTMNDLWNIIPVNPPVSVVDLTGAEIRSMLEENLERTFAADPFCQMGGYVKRCLGVELYLKIENPPGYRIERMFIDGGPFDPQATHRVAFVTEQGVPQRLGHNRRHLSITAIQALRAHLKDAPAKLRPSRVVAI